MCIHYFSCKKSGMSPFCVNCTKSVTILQRALAERTLIQRKKYKVSRICNECISQDTDFNLEFITCSNMSCNIMEKRLQVVKSPLISAIQQHSLYDETNKPVYLSD